MDETVNQAVDTPAPDANTPEPGSEAAPSPAARPEGEKDGFTKRIDELTRHWRETERDRDHWRELALRNQQPREEPKPVESAAPKTLADFEFDEAKYQTYLFEQAEQRAVKAAERRLQEQQEREAAERRKSSFAQRESEFAKSTKDYHEKTRDPRVPVSQAMAEVIAESEEGPAVAYYLANNLPMAEQIARLPPLAAARELGRIEAKLAAEREAAKAAEKRVSQAPQPPPKVEGAADGAGPVDPSTPESDKLSDAEWARRREAQLKRKRA
jgi:hypothetical protein